MWTLVLAALVGGPLIAGVAGGLVFWLAERDAPAIIGIGLPWLVGMGTAFLLATVIA